MFKKSEKQKIFGYLLFKPLRGGGVNPKKQKEKTHFISYQRKKNMND